MQKLLVFALLWVFALSVFAQDTTSTEPNYIPVIAYWNKHDTFHYALVRGTKKFKKDEMIDSSAILTPLTLVVEDSTEKSYTLKVFTEFVPRGLDNYFTKKEIKDVLNPIRFPALEYMTDEKGTFEAFKNIDKVHKTYVSFLDKLFSEKAKKETPEKAKELQFLKSKLTTRRYFETAYFQEIQVLHKFHGLSYAQDSIWYFDLEVDNAFRAGEKLTVPNELHTTMPEDWGGLVRLENYSEIDGEMAMGLISALLGESKTEELKGEFKKKPPTYETYISYAIDPGTGVVFAVYQQTTAFLGEDKIMQNFMELNSID